MTKEILFRGQRVDNGEWVYGMPLESKFNCTYMLTIQGGLSADFIYSRYTILDSKDSIAVKTESIGQFTGLLDKNGNKIFEGDVFISTADKEVKKMKVVYDKECASFRLNSIKDSDKWSMAWTNKNEIIGNIHENP